MKGKMLFQCYRLDMERVEYTNCCQLHAKRNFQWMQRNLVNDGMISFLGKDNCIQHHRIIRKSYLFRDDGIHLSDIGNDYPLEDFRLKIKQNILF